MLFLEVGVKLFSGDFSYFRMNKTSAQIEMSMLRW